jgi:hypothetical protein
MTTVIILYDMSIYRSQIYAAINVKYNFYYSVSPVIYINRKMNNTPQTALYS